MAHDTIWKGYISFGLVEIPVELVTAEVSHELALKLFDRRDHTPVGNKRVSKVTGDEVPWSEVVKGYEYSDGEYVLLADQELKAANPEATQTIEIVDFVDAAEVHPAYFEKPYYLRPTRKRGHKAYRLLHETLEHTGRLGIARVVIRTRQRLAALTTRDGALMLSLLRYAHELRSPQEAGLSPAEEGEQVTKQELGLAERLVQDMSGSWKPEKYQDDYRDDLLALIERKARAGQLEPVETPERAGREPEETDVLDLMPLLKRSVERAGEKPSRRREPASRAKRHPPRRRSA
jgi:DNA end-binding protein Ku